MKWEKRGLVWGPSGDSGWARSHATVPTPVALRDGEIRLYVGVLDADGVGRVTYVDVDAADPSRVLRESERPVLDIGERGTFDDNGVLPSVVVPVGDRLFMYYNGFQLHTKIRYTIFSGLAVSDDGGETFERIGRKAVLDRTDRETTFRAAPFVAREDDRWRIWYPAGDSWVTLDGKEVPIVRLRYAESDDGITWPDHGELVLELEGDEHGIGRPWVERDGDTWRMYYSIRRTSDPHGSYLGFAESSDGMTWTRKDEELGIAHTKGSWDEAMLRYGVTHHHGDDVYLFYNGDKFGEAGFGYARRVG